MEECAGQRKAHRGRELGKNWGHSGIQGKTKAESLQSNDGRPWKKEKRPRPEGPGRRDCIAQGASEGLSDIRQHTCVFGKENITLEWRMTQREMKTERRQWSQKII